MKPLSFIIITYNRVADTLELLQNISSLNKASELLEDVIIVNNASDDDYTPIKHYIQENTSLPFNFIDAPENLGVTKGRNFALQFAKAAICIFLDDDAILQNKDALENVLKSFEGVGMNNREVAIVSFKVLYYDNLEMQVNALPHKNFKEYQSLPYFFTYYFAGGAHAIKRKALDEVGNLPETFFYGMEEYDVSYRIINKGYCIKYDASIIMLHKESAQGRKPKHEKLRMMWVNKAIVAYRYLPIGYFYTTAIMWSLQYLKETKFNIKGFVKGWKEVLQIFSSEKRTMLNKKSLEYLYQTKARLWY
ncbi:MAG: glycosyltransferase family 2 protein [Chitinophagaceae bacterium]|nr:glycosyltransferase family 2 protein [Chitinophagaceae bacterium]MCW5905413.1 glycosyltransferase family 2 protein [Chitinophagaceae bacterium]